MYDSIEIYRFHAHFCYHYYLRDIYSFIIYFKKGFLVLYQGQNNHFRDNVSSLPYLILLGCIDTTLK